jgi:hypothetical protein
MLFQVVQQVVEEMEIIGQIQHLVQQHLHMEHQDQFQQLDIFQAEVGVQVKLIHQQQHL